MSTPRYARLAGRVLEQANVDAPPPRPEVRAVAVGAIERALAQRARAKARRRWAGRIAVAAAVAAVAVGGATFWTRHGREVARQPAPGDVRVTGRALSGAANVFVAGEATPMVEGRPLPAGSRVVAAKTARVLLAFSTGTSGLLDDAGDVTLESIGASEALRLEAGSIDLAVAKQAPGERFIVRTPDAEVEVRGTQFRVAIAPADAACGGGTGTRVAVSEGVVVVRHAGSEARVSAGEVWPSGCAAGASASSEAAVAPSVARGPAAAGSSASSLAAQNDLFARAIAAKRRGDGPGAVAGFDRFLARYPSGPLSESATVERMRLLRASDPSRAAAAASAYLARYPGGFAHAEAEAIVAGAP
jgi:ferric-dicitrate binding protein FerR (iron transport regulator)